MPWQLSKILFICFFTSVRYNISIGNFLGNIASFFSFRILLKHMRQSRHNSKILSPINGIQFLLVLFSICISAVICPAAESNEPLPELKSQVSPLDPLNQPLLFKRFVAAFDRQYAVHLRKNESKNLSDDMAVYYLRQELQALIDMWRATGKSAYLEQ